MILEGALRMQLDHAVVTIGREYGSGGHEIGKKLAEMMGISFYDKEILTRAAKESGICEDLFEQYDEKATPSYLFSLTAGMSAATEGAGLSMGMPLNHRIFLAQFEAITNLASEGPCVIVGRCGDYVLKENKNAINLFLYADVEARIQRIMAVEGLPHDKAKDLVRRVDKQRQNYYNFFADGNWGNRGNYHLMLCTTGLTTQSAAELLMAFVQKRA